MQSYLCHTNVGAITRHFTKCRFLNEKKKEDSFKSPNLTYGTCIIGHLVFLFPFPLYTPTALPHNNQNEIVLAFKIS